MLKLLWSILIPLALAQANSPALTGIQLSQIPTPGAGWTDLASVVSALIKFLMIIAALATFFYLLLGGLKWITSGGDAKQTETAGKQITNALIGLGIVAGAYAIMLILEKFFKITILSGAITIPTPN